MQYKYTDISDILTKTNNNPFRLGFNSKKQSDLCYGGEYTKSTIESDEFDGGIYYINEPIPYIYRIYETLTDSQGRSHSVQVDYEQKEIRLNDEHIKLHNNSFILTTKNCPIEPDQIYFQFNLKRYCIIYWDRGFDHLAYFRNLTRDITAHTPEQLAHSKKFEAMDVSGFAPFYEFTFNTQQQYISDMIFFNCHNRRNAIERVCAGYNNNMKNRVFGEFDYINANDIELIDFMNDRFSKRIKYENYLNRMNYYTN